jgi:Na+/phosphate symporter
LGLRPSAALAIISESSVADLGLCPIVTSVGVVPLGSVSKLLVSITVLAGRITAKGSALSVSNASRQKKDGDK